MGIKIFVNSLLLLAIGIYFVPVENNINKADEKDIPLVVFEKPLMYTLTKDNLTRVVEASHAVKYKNRDEMFNASIVLKNIDKKKEFNQEKIKSDLIISHGDILNFKDNVKYTRDDFISLKTQKMYYNIKDKVAYNDVAYSGNYYKNILNGTNLYLDTKEGIIKSKNIHYEFDMKK